ncbi:hypothetical protein BZZ01_00355 [Nostocales cyanobacterium HT-58-2]|nr:hypothetical protein BZZ01_00355 [Nostocales cyanobacterium HT-58-2]
MLFSAVYSGIFQGKKVLENVIVKSCWLHEVIVLALRGLVNKMKPCEIRFWQVTTDYRKIPEKSILHPLFIRK